MDDMLLSGLNDEWSDVRSVLARAGLTSKEWNFAAGRLHALGREGVINRTKALAGHWLFKKTPDETALVIEPKEPKVLEHDGLPAWARPPVWQPADGPIEGVWSGKPRGHRCYWSCRWADLVQRPEDIGYHLDSMSNAQLYYELRDVADRGDFEASQLLPSLGPEEPAGNPKLWQRARQILQRARNSYEEFVAPWWLSAMIKGLHWRPGWEFIAPWPARLSRNLGGQWSYIEPEFPGRNVEGGRVTILSAEREFGGVSAAELREARVSLHQAMIESWKG